MIELLTLAALSALAMHNIEAAYRAWRTQSALMRLDDANATAATYLQGVSA